MDTSQQKKMDFERLVKEHFKFAEYAQMRFNGIRNSGGADPRDATLAARYSNDKLRFDVGWREHELLLTVLIKFDSADLSSKERYVLLEPFIEYLTQGREKAIVPYITKGMSIRKMESVIEQRKTLFVRGLELVIKALGEKMKANFGVLMSATKKQVEGYHEWMRR